METTHTPPGAIAARKILIEIIDQKTSRNAVAVKAGFAPTTFGRRLDRPEQFTIQELGEVAAALNLNFTDLFKDAA